MYGLPYSLGRGGYYAPDLTKVMDRRGKGYVKAVLMTPISWALNGRKVVAYGFSKEEANDVIAFFDWIDDIDLNGFDRVVSPLSKDEKSTD